MFNSLIEAQDLYLIVNDSDTVVVDCRFSLQDTEAGRKAYLESHIPGAVYAHLDEDLSGMLVAGTTGRHPLPDVAHCEQLFSKWGIDAAVQVVVYDDQGAAFASRLWWMLRWLGHDKVAVLNGGWKSWKQKQLPVSQSIQFKNPRLFVPVLQEDLTVTAEQLVANLSAAEFQVVDSRAPERYSGEVEPIDPVAGHIPGAHNFPFGENLDQDGRFHSSEALRARFRPLGNAASTVFYCGSGVTACHNVLAWCHAGLGMPRLYPGSWSEWITDDSRPVERS